MSGATMIVLIVLIAVVGRFLTARSKHGPDMRKVSADKEALEREVSALKQRIAVLERIATDKSRRLADEIDGLEGTGNPDMNENKE